MLNILWLSKFKIKKKNPVTRYVIFNEQRSDLNFILEGHT